MFDNSGEKYGSFYYSPTILTSVCLTTARRKGAAPPPPSFTRLSLGTLWTKFVESSPLHIFMVGEKGSLEAMTLGSSSVAGFETRNSYAE
jgi:hypothetical protein